MSPAAAARSEIDIDEFERRLRGPSQRPVADPLAELARLVAGNADDKPAALDALFARPALVPVPERPVHPPAPEPHFEPDLRDSFDEDLPHPTEDRHSMPALEDNMTVPHNEDLAAEEVDWSNAMAVPPPPAASRSRMPLYATAAVIAVGLMGIGATFAFKSGGGSSADLVEIKAAPGPTKVAGPLKQDTGIPAKETTVLDRGAQTPPVKQVVTRQEQPVDITTVATRPRTIPMTGDAQPSAPQSAVIGDLAEPRRVKTVAVRPDGSIIGAPTVAMPLATDSAPPAASAPPAPAAKTVTPKSDNRVATTPKPAAPAEKPVAAKPPAPAKPVAQKPAAKPDAKVARADDDTDAADAAGAAAAPKPTAGGGGGWAVQVAAPATEAEARSAAARFASKYGSALGGAHLTFRKAADKDVYRVRAAGLSREDAVATCEKIKAAGGPCFVAKN